MTWAAVALLLTVVLSFTAEPPDACVAQRIGLGARAAQYACANRSSCAVIADQTWKAWTGGKTADYAVVHVGPHKTGTKTIQQAISKVAKELANDNYTIPWGNHSAPPYERNHVGHANMFWLAKCFYDDCVKNGGMLNPLDVDRARCIPSGLDAVHRVAAAGKNLVVTSEAFAHEPVAVARLPDLFRAWRRVTVVVVYRRFFSWLGSVHFQTRRWTPIRDVSRPGGVRSRGAAAAKAGGRRRGGDAVGGTPRSGRDAAAATTESRRRSNGGVATPPPRGPSGPRRVGQVMTNEMVDYYWTSIYSLPTFRRYARHFDDFRFINLHDGRDLVETFFCESLPSAPRACAAARALGAPHNHEGYELTFRLIVAGARRRGILDRPGRKNKHKTLAHKPINDLAEKVRERQTSLKKGPYDFPMACMHPGLLQKIREKSLAAEEALLPEFFRSPDGRAKLLSEFDVHARTRLCDVNASAVLEDPSWVAFFASVEHDFP